MIENVRKGRIFKEQKILQNTVISWHLESRILAAPARDIKSQCAQIFQDLVSSRNENSSIIAFLELYFAYQYY